MKTSARIRSQSRRSKWIVYPTVALALVTFFSFVAESTYLGGDALNGYARAGHYFVCAHGRCTEVSQEIWKFSRWHAIGAIGAIVLVMMEFAIFVNTGDIELDFDSRR